MSLQRSDDNLVLILQPTNKIYQKSYYNVGLGTDHVCVYSVFCFVTNTGFLCVLCEEQGVSQAHSAQ